MVAVEGVGGELRGGRGAGGGWDEGGEGVVAVEDQVLGAVGAVVALAVSALDDGEGAHDVVHIVAGDAVEVEHQRVQLGSHQSPALVVPAERRAMIPEVFCEAGQIPSGVG